MGGVGRSIHFDEADSGEELEGSTQSAKMMAIFLRSLPQASLFSLFCNTLLPKSLRLWFVLKFPRSCLICLVSSVGRLKHFRIDRRRLFLFCLEEAVLLAVFSWPSGSVELFCSGQEAAPLFVRRF